MDEGDHDDDENQVLAHSKFWKARRGGGASLRQGGTEPPDPHPKLPPPSFMTSTCNIHLPRIEQGQRIDHPFHSRSPRRALSSAIPPPLDTTDTPGTLEPAAATLANAHFQSNTTVFRFDSTDRERYLCSAISEEEEVFSPVPDNSKHFDSPAIRISKLHIDSSPPPSPLPEQMENQNNLMSRLHTGIAMLPTTSDSSLFGLPSSPISPLTPNTPLSPSPLFSEHNMFQQGFLAELYRRRCHSDSDLRPLTPESCRNEPTDLTLKSIKTKSTRVRSRKSIPHPLTIPTKGGSLESDQSSPQDSPLDLSVRSNLDRFGNSTSCESLSSRFISSLVVPSTTAGGFSTGSHGIEPTSPTTTAQKHSVASRYNLDVSPVVEKIPRGSDSSFVFVCPICGQSFSLHDRLAKHMASRHKSKPHDPSKSYPCDVCHRSFARSDMLTRHMRLHTGVKPYTCRVCGQVFSRSDHLSTHQRTHTGEKPYKCPQCPYSACRRDMITRHLRTHSRSSSSSSELQTPTSTCFPNLSDSMEMELLPIKMEPYPSRPPSSTSSLPPDSPLTPSLSSLHVHSPTSPSRSTTKE